MTTLRVLRLCLDHNPLGDGGVRALARMLGSGTARLEHLDLSLRDVQLTDVGLGVLVRESLRPLTSATLCSLSLRCPSNPGVTWVGAGHVANLADGPRLVRLAVDLSRTNLGDLGVAAVVMSPWWPSKKSTTTGTLRGSDGATGTSRTWSCGCRTGR